MAALTQTLATLNADAGADVRREEALLKTGALQNAILNSANFSSIATDSKGNLYTTETYEGKRVQKFAYKGLGSVSRANQGVLWPKR